MTHEGKEFEKMYLFQLEKTISLKVFPFLPFHKHSVESLKVLKEEREKSFEKKKWTGTQR